MDISLVDALVRKQCQNKLYRLYEPKPVGNIIPFKTRDTYHVFIDLPRLSLQLAVFVRDNSVMSSLFVSPQIIRPETRDAFVHLANAANCAEVAFGQFVVDDNDLTYLTWVPDWMIEEHPEEARQALFSDGVRRYEQMQEPLLGLAVGLWSAEKAVRYIETLYDQGYVRDDEFE